MALNIKNVRVERLATDVARVTGESKTEAIRKALEERQARLATRINHDRRRDRLMRFLEREVWSAVPANLLGRTRSRKEEDAILGFGKEGV
jgi:antitoxin VapB